MLCIKSVTVTDAGGKLGGRLCEVLVADDFDVARAVTYLLSDAAECINGSVSTRRARR